METLTEKDLDWLRRIFAKTGGRGWEPPNPKHPFYERAIKAGFLRRTAGRCGFERFKDSHITFTEAGRAALQAPASGQ